MDGASCQTVLEALVETGFLSKRSDGAYGRYRNPDISRARQAKAGIEPGAGADVSRPCLTVELVRCCWCDASEDDTDRVRSAVGL